MQPPSPSRRVHGDELATSIRDIRARFDALDRGEVAHVRRSRSARELVLEPVYWRVVGDVSARHAEIAAHGAHVVLLFPYAKHRAHPRFATGRYFRDHLGDGDGAALRFRRLLACESREELDHRMRGVLRLVAGEGAPVDWGVLGRDLLWFFAESNRVRRDWAQDFYAPLRTADPAANPESPST